DDESVVAIAAVEIRDSEVVEHDEEIFAFIAVDGDCKAYTVREESFGRLDGRISIRFGDVGAVRRVAERARRLVKLSDLEEVVAVARIDRNRGACVVEVELIVAA